jgi:hypothetical protein
MAPKPPGHAGRLSFTGRDGSLPSMKTFTEAQRRTVALGWASSGLDQATYAAKHGISARTLRGWIVRFPSRQPAAEQVRAIVTELMEKLQAVLDGLDVPSGMPGGNEDEEPEQPTSIAMSPAGAACPAAPPPAPLPRPRPAPAPAPPMAPAAPPGIKTHPNSIFWGI